MQLNVYVSMSMDLDFNSSQLSKTLGHNPVAKATKSLSRIVYLIVLEDSLRLRKTAQRIGFDDHTHTGTGKPDWDNKHSSRESLCLK